MDHAQKALSRVIWQYRNSPKFLEWIQLLPQIANQEIELPLETLNNLLDFENQEGELLNIVGRIVGQDRGGLDDDTYKILIRSKIYRNNSDVRIDSIIEATEFITGVGVFILEDGQDMTFTLIFSEPIEDDIRELIITFDLIPRPQGVRLTGLVDPSEPPNFGFAELDEETPDEILGFSELDLFLLELDDDDTLELSDGSDLGMLDADDPITDGGGKFSELFEV